MRGVSVIRPNQVWSIDITYIRLAHGFAYLAAIIDWYSRRVLSWRLSNSMEAVFCVDCLEDALRTHGRPEIFNSDQGSQFTSDAFTGVLKREGIVISMDGRGRAFATSFRQAQDRLRRAALAQRLSAYALGLLLKFAAPVSGSGCFVLYPCFPPLCLLSGPFRVGFLAVSLISHRISRR